MSVAPDGPDDRGAVDAFLRGRDEAAFDLLYGRHTPKLMGLALRLSAGDEPQAAEIVQEAWVRALPQLGRFRWQSSLSTWLGAFVVNVWREESGDGPVAGRTGRWWSWVRPGWLKPRVWPWT